MSAAVYGLSKARFSLLFPPTRPQMQPVMDDEGVLSPRMARVVRETAAKQAVPVLAIASMALAMGMISITAATIL